MLQRIEMDDRIGLADQLAGDVGPVILVNTFRVAPEERVMLKLSLPSVDGYYAI